MTGKSIVDELAGAMMCAEGAHDWVCKNKGNGPYRVFRVLHNPHWKCLRCGASEPTHVARDAGGAR